ncbi:MAG TPA: beta-N-acetylhexosaminidase [Gammaproteobacteria bacterium]|nr:beta-N-acetylhexosaminidase [Gammaproteobacteria bacterium]
MLGPIWIDLLNTTLTEEEKSLLEKESLGGIILFSRNYENPEQILKLTESIRTYRPDCLIGVDQEGGRVQRFRLGLSRLPSLGTLGALLDNGDQALDAVCDMAKKLGQLMAMEIGALGVDISFAPVLDRDLGKCDVVGDRAFHSDPKIISALALSYVQGMNQAGMAATGKHFPGHGNVSLDSHHALPIDERKFSEITDDLAPFNTLIQNGIQALMPAHILFPNIDPLPVGGSKYWLQNILRQALGFSGTIISDDLSMKAANVFGSPCERAEKAFEAGCDIILICNDRAAQKEVLQKVQPNPDKARDRRIYQLKAKIKNPTWPDLADDLTYQSCRAVLEEINNISKNIVKAVEF